MIRRALRVRGDCGGTTPPSAAVRARSYATSRSAFLPFYRHYTTSAWSLVPTSSVFASNPTHTPTSISDRRRTRTMIRTRPMSIPMTTLSASLSLASVCTPVRASAPASASASASATTTQKSSDEEIAGLVQQLGEAEGEEAVRCLQMQLAEKLLETPDEGDNYKITDVPIEDRLTKTKAKASHQQSSLAGCPASKAGGAAGSRFLASPQQQELLKILGKLTNALSSEVRLQHLQTIQSLNAPSLTMSQYLFLIEQCGQVKKWDWAIHYMEQMQKANFPPTATSLIAVINACEGGANWKKMHTYLLELNAYRTQRHMEAIQQNMAFSYSSATATSAQALKSSLALEKSKSLINLAEHAHGQGPPSKSIPLECFKLRSKLLPGLASLSLFNAAIRGACASNDWPTVKQILAEMTKRAMPPDMQTFSTVIKFLETRLLWRDLDAVLRTMRTLKAVHNKFVQHVHGRQLLDIHGLNQNAARWVVAHVLYERKVNYMLMKVTTATPITPAVSAAFQAASTVDDLIILTDRSTTLNAVSMERAIGSKLAFMLREEFYPSLAPVVNAGTDVTVTIPAAAMKVWCEFVPPG